MALYETIDGQCDTQSAPLHENVLEMNSESLFVINLSEVQSKLWEDGQPKQVCMCFKIGSEDEACTGTFDIKPEIESESCSDHY